MNPFLLNPVGMLLYSYILSLTLISVAFSLLAVNICGWVGSQSSSCDSMIWLHSSISSSVGYRVFKPHVDQFIFSGMNSFSHSNPNFLPFGSVGSSQRPIPKALHWYGFMSYLSNLFPNHNPCPNMRIITSPFSRVYAVAPVHILMFSCSLYSAKNGTTVHPHLTLTLTLNIDLYSV